MSEQVRLGPVVESDLPVLFQWINDRDLVLSSAPYKAVDFADHEAWFKDIRSRGDVVVFAIRLKDSDRLVGTCQLHSVHRIHRSAQLQIRLGDAQYRGKGFGSQAIRLLVRHGFRDLGLHRIYLHVLQNNLAAIRTYQKAGFQTEGCLRKAAFIDGQFLDVIVMGLLADD
ncbi:MAG TPA: GNAT family protein [Pyrinomonadaceae bacterium]|nr:GNAT family protein [Pyrinomonadaceae bacterium]